MKREGKMEVWAKKNFPAGGLIFLPDTTEYKDRYYTQTRSALLQNAESVEGKRIVLDGRLRAAPTELRGFSLFFAIARSEDATETCLKEAYSEFEMSMQWSLPGTKCSKQVKRTAASLPQIPYMFNPKPVKRGTKLVCNADLEMKKLVEANAKAQAEAAQAAKKAKTVKK